MKVQKACGERNKGRDSGGRSETVCDDVRKGERVHEIMST